VRRNPALEFDTEVEAMTLGRMVDSDSAAQGIAGYTVGSWLAYGKEISNYGDSKRLIKSRVMCGVKW
jgi:hypothetical protein